LNIPDEDKPDYREIFNSSKLTDNIFSAGAKITFQINEFQIYGDFRHAFGSSEKIPVKGLKGFSSNIGVVFNAEIFTL
jgi:hypothetical protein